MYMFMDKSSFMHIFLQEEFADANKTQENVLYPVLQYFHTDMTSSLVFLFVHFPLITLTISIEKILLFSIFLVCAHVKREILHV